jgi:alkylated DNA repair protein (DNA oxidative demethylase)
MVRSAYQKKLFDTGTTLPNGFVYRPDFLTKEEEKELLDWFEDLPFEHPMQEGYEAKRRVMSFGWSYDFVASKIVKGPALPPFLVPIARKIAKWLDIPKERVVEALITEYPVGATIGWHRDNESFESIIGVSLGSWCRLRLRPRRSRFRTRSIADVVSLELEPRSAYLMQKDSRWDFQHSIPSVPELRYSITFRTLPRGMKFVRT